MTIIKNTISLCPVCYREIPATIYIDGVVMMHKVCPVHGVSEGIVEKDVAFYIWCLNHPSDIYDGHLVDVTTRCNLNCKYCYYDKGNEDIPIDEIVNECMVNRGPYILTGGEPTLRQDLPEIICRCSEIGPTFFLTNGTGLLDKEYLKACNEHTFKRNGFSGIGLSYHSEFDKFNEVVDTMKACEIKPQTIFFVIDSLGDLEKVKRFSEANKGFSEVTRIKCASNVWNEDKAGRLFVSDVLDWFKGQGEIKAPDHGKVSYMPFYQNGVTYAAISWHDVTNVDLLDINCPPTYRAKNGQVTDFVRAMLINEGIAKGVR